MNMVNSKQRSLVKKNPNQTRSSMVHKSRRAVLMMVTVLSVRFARVATFQPGRQLERMWQRACLNHGFLQHDLRVACRLSSFSDDGDSVVGLEAERDIPLLLAEGLFAVAKPLEWTSNDVVSYIRGILERDARNRGAKPVRVGSRRNKSQIVRVGHGGTLDPLATGVLVIGIGKGTKQLQIYLEGPKGYRAGAELGFETTTLDMEGNITKVAPFDHVRSKDVEAVLPEFIGKIQQIPPIFSAIRKDGKQLYKEARAGKSADDIEIESREVEVVSIQLLNFDLPRFDMQVQCGSGTYIRSLIRDIGHKLNSVATTTFLERTQQGQFKLEDALAKEDWTPDNIYNAIDKLNAERRHSDGHQ